MTLWAIVPMKPLRLGKSRLSNALSENARVALNRSLLENTLVTLKVVQEVEHVLVISRDPQVLAISRQQGVRTLMEHGGSNLNIAVARASLVAKRYGARGVLVVPADLPLISQEELRQVVQAGTKPPVVVVVPDRHGTGTNTILISPVGLIDYRFGIGSFQAHCEQARQAIANLEVCRLPLLALDIDVPEDLDLLKLNLPSFSY
jgi:2-phospho-L-lactate guanylyltransferase